MGRGKDRQGSGAGRGARFLTVKSIARDSGGLDYFAREVTPPAFGNETCDRNLSTRGGHDDGGSSRRRRDIDLIS